MTDKSKLKIPFWMKAVFTLFFMAIISISALIYIDSPVDKEADSSIFIVEEGESLGVIAQNLEKKGYIRTHYLIRMIRKITKDERSVRTGSYRISPSFSTHAIYNKLLKGEQELVTITIPEGWTLRQIAKLLEEKGVTDYQGFLDAAHNKDILDSLKIMGNSCEGYLFPDTYHMPKDYDPYYILNLFLNNFRKKMDSVYPDWRDMTSEQLYDKIIMASIVEKEYRNPEEAPLISSVFYNRLDSWYPRLESCATVTYVITDIYERPHPERLTDVDIQIDNDYNTYERSGLPPGPIANPGIIALNASFYPAKTNYIYFVVKDIAKGTHNFSSNYDDFMVDKVQYLRSYRSK